MQRKVDFEKLLEKVPDGHWAAVSADYTAVLASGLNGEELRRKHPQALILKKSSDVHYSFGFQLPSLS